MQTRFIRSPFILAAVALAWVAGIVLLHVSYVQPNLARQITRIENDSAAEWLRLSNHFMRSQKNQMHRITATWARGASLVRFAQTEEPGLADSEFSPEALVKNRISQVLVCDRQRRVIASWQVNNSGELVIGSLPVGTDLSDTMFFQLCSAQEETSGIGNSPLGLAIFARCAIRPGDDPEAQPLGYVLSARPMDGLFMAEVSAMVGTSITIQSTPPMPDGQTVPAFGQAVWRADGARLRGVQVFRDALGAPTGYLVVEGEAKATYRHTRTVERALGMTLVWATGFALLMILVIHVVVSGPTAKLLSRVQRLRAGEEIKSLSADLRGEALALAKQFDEVLAHVEKLSQTDSLTGLSNRRCFQQAFVKEFRRARRYGRPLSLAIVDADFFKAANDAMGHQIGDQMLQVFAQVIMESVRVSDTVSRIGGDEFAVLMPETPCNEAVVVAERIRLALGQRSVGRGEMKMTLAASIGLVDMNAQETDTPEALFNLADQALYAAKRGGRNRVVRADELDQVANVQQAQDHNRVDDLCKQLAGLDAKFKRLFVDAIGGLISALEARDVHTANHSAKVRRYARMIARQMNLPERIVEHLGRAAMLHDIGKIGLPDSVLLKEGPLTDSEWQLVRRHPVMSVRIMEGMEFLDQEIPAVRYHHERYDGGGYPEGLTGSAIPLPARILSVADAFDAMVSSRVYRTGMSVAKAVEELRRGSGSHFDPAVVDAFMQVIANENITDQTVAVAVSPRAA